MNAGYMQQDKRAAQSGPWLYCAVQVPGQVAYLALYFHQNRHEKTSSSHLVVRVQHEDFRRFCFYFAEVIQITETGTHCEMNTVVVLKEGTPTEKKTSHQS